MCRFSLKMEHETIKYDGELEEGELSDSDGDYTPLQRPENVHEQTNMKIKQQQQQSDQKKDSKMDDTVDDAEDSVSDFGASSDSLSDSDDVIYAVKNDSNDSGKQKKKQKKRRTVLLRVKPSQDNENCDDDDINKQNEQRNSKFKKYNIWTASIQEESLSENMRGIDVNKYPKNDRNVENYDFSWKYKLEKRNGNGGFKRRMSSNNSGDDFSDNTYSHQSKRSKHNADRGSRKLIKNQLGRRESTSDSCDSQNAPRYILDLNVNIENENIDIARDIANKLYEEKDELMLRAVEVLGKQMPMDIFKETQRIERDGGMMIMNGIRRRTPGGVFLFLLKHHDNISPEDKKLIFRDDVKATVKERKKLLATKRDKKVEELKKQLNLKEKELPALSKRIDIPIMCHLKPDTHTNLSNPPPSPVTNSGLENSPDYSSHEINHVNDASPEKSTIRSNDDEGLVTYDDECIDMNYSDMDLF